ncbi:hypothetical protein OHS70_07970 [Streptomyces sp. NBC_00390]|uniref:hypothetical protein n=1 Tax=Streptomyces sp. NBC_00390 TaxID=2975736 RepID=UPI002E23BBEE
MRRLASAIRDAQQGRDAGHVILADIRGSTRLAAEPVDALRRQAVTDTAVPGPAGSAVLTGHRVEPLICDDFVG